jgi:hypothetical protein
LQASENDFVAIQKKDAERVLAEKLTEINKGSYTEIPKLTFMEYAKIWLKGYVKMNLKPFTLPFTTLSRTSI